MFNFTINWLKIIKENVSASEHSSSLFDLIKVLISPINKIYQEFLIAYKVLILKIRFNGQIIYLEKILNDKFSPVSGGIYIASGVTAQKYYLYNSIELKPQRYLYSNWKAPENYLIGEFSVYQNKVWRAITNNTGNIPSVTSSHWVFHKDIEFLRTKGEFSINYNFIVMVPVSITFNITEMMGIIEYYKLAGLRYIIRTY